MAAAHLPTEIGDGIRHDLQGVRAVPAPHGEKQILLGKRDPRIAGEKQQHIELDPGQRQCGSVLKRLLGSSVNGQLREGKRVPGTEGDRSAAMSSRRSRARIFSSSSLSAPFA